MNTALAFVALIIFIVAALLGYFKITHAAIALIAAGLAVWVIATGAFDSIFT